MWGSQRAGGSSGRRGEGGRGGGGGGRGVWSPSGNRGSLFLGTVGRLGCPHWTLRFPSLPSPSWVLSKPLGNRAACPGLLSSPAWLLGCVLDKRIYSGGIWDASRPVGRSPVQAGTHSMARSGAEAQLGSGHARPACGDQPLSKSNRAVREGHHSAGGDFCTQGEFSGPSLAGERGPQWFAGSWGWRQGPTCLGGGLPPSLAPPALRACLLPASPPFFPDTCRCFRRQSQGAEEGRASAHIVLQGGLRGPGPQVARLEGRHTPRPWPHFLGRPGCGFPGALGGGAEVISPFSSSEGTLPRVSLLLDTFPPETPLDLFSPKHLRGVLCLPGYTELTHALSGPVGARCSRPRIQAPGQGPILAG